ncbi:hypothetical protein [uncultured Shewanella sp.]|uniref:hypothetical protein n=1 Tax=uncultured Shewanella sp. TaxID=173975 RepID=UPI00261F52FE|nr:hypothetical protein [uncultured Shewanella sp.]
MSSLSRLIRAIFITSPAKLGRMLLIVILTMQSMVTMADDCTSAHDDCGSEVTYVAEHTNGTVNNTSQCDEVETASHVEDDCAECSNNCCSCCMTLMHPITALKSVTASPNSHIFAFSSTSIESPYFAFLRPPKALIV